MLQLGLPPFMSTLLFTDIKHTVAPHRTVPFITDQGQCENSSSQVSGQTYWFRSRPSKRTTLSTKTCCYLTLTAPLSSPSSSIRISCHLHSVVRSVSFSHSDLRALTFSMNSPSISACSSAQSPGLGRHYAF
mmetsp:Transcript_30363/g.97754  ORF Transcript_30363/g.97754 Transcript_30363/m.97754 type:complete len:132 (+) Transcript_30363:1273-1668(+)